VYLGVSHAAHPDSGVPALPNFGVLLYLCLHPLTQNDQILLGNTHGEGCVFRQLARGGVALADPNFAGSPLLMRIHGLT